MPKVSLINYKNRVVLYFGVPLFSYFLHFLSWCTNVRFRWKMWIFRHNLKVLWVRRVLWEDNKWIFENMFLLIISYLYKKRWYFFILFFILKKHIFFIFFQKKHKFWDFKQIFDNFRYNYNKKSLKISFFPF